MLTREIPRNEWPAFFDDFSRNYQGWTVTVEILNPNIGAQVEAHELPLEGITVDLKEDGKDEISIIIGEAPEDHVTHNILVPIHVWVEQTDKGDVEALQIESESGITMLLRFCSTWIKTASSDA
ncbi:MAG: DUF5335 family protein [Acidobacteriota bacterium]